MLVHGSADVVGLCHGGHAGDLGALFGGPLRRTEGECGQGHAFLTVEGWHCRQDFVDLVLEGVDWFGENFGEALNGGRGEVGLDLGGSSLDNARDAVVALELVGQADETALEVGSPLGAILGMGQCEQLAKEPCMCGGPFEANAGDVDTTAQKGGGDSAATQCAVEVGVECANISAQGVLELLELGSGKVVQHSG